ncbi:hypothetical protein BV22DRAFT_970049, partial [Leucogyrophana mollusca]
ALVCAGFLGCSPVSPSVAISLDCLELYHQIRRRQASFSIQAITKVLCALHNVTYSQHLRDQFSIAFDVYLSMLREVQKKCNQALNRAGPDSRLRHACPACTYVVQNEPKLIPSALRCMDGNNSAKRMEGSGPTDHRTFESQYFIPDAEVERFKDDVRLRPGERPSAPGDPEPDTNSTDPDLCSSHWKAANVSEENKHHVFEQTGIFLSACRHGIVHTIAEMRRSGELAKYPLATIKKLLDVFGDNMAIGSDIGCSLQKTVKASSIGVQAARQHLMLAVNAFHGWAHDRLCQLRNHPLYLKGFGLEDLETCERVFSASNATAPLIRHASHFHWRQFLELHFMQWDKDKYLELSRFLFNNYVQALTIIRDYTAELTAFKTSTNTQDQDFEHWMFEEFNYLLSVAREPEQDAMLVVYVTELDKLCKAQAAYGAVTSVQFMTYSPGHFTSSSGLSHTAQQVSKDNEARRRAAQRRLEFQMHVVDDIECKLEISERWTTNHPEYIRVAEYARQREFIRVVEHLESLVVQRLFELAKANLAATGKCYKLRKHIAKAIARRSGTIRAALNKYNELAPLQTPRRPTLTYSQVISYASIGEFALLKYSRYDVLTKPWSDSTKREIAIKHFKVQRAREELIRLNVEIRRLHAWVDTEDKELRSVMVALKATDPFIAAEISLLSAEQRRVNDIHRMRLTRIYALEGYSG